MEKKYREIILYLIYGVATTGVNWLVYTMCVKVFGIPMTLSNAIAWVIAVNFAYITNRRYVFESKVSSWKKISMEYMKFVGGRGFSGMLEVFLPAVLYYVGMTQGFLGIDGGIAKLVAMLISNVINYVLSKMLVFK